jgi:hypothetical protein
MWIEGGDANAHSQPQPKMARLPFNLVTQPNKPGHCPADSSFFCVRDGILVKINAPRKIKAPFHWSLDAGLKNDFRGLPLFFADSDLSFIIRLRGAYWCSLPQRFDYHPRKITLDWSWPCM